MPVSVRWEVRSEEALKKLRGVDLRTRDLTPVLQDFAAYMRDSVLKNFDAGGRPATWAPLKVVARAGMSKLGAAAPGGRKLLIDRGFLRASIYFRGSARSVEGFAGSGPSAPYAAIHQFGGRTKAHVIAPRTKKALAWPGGAHPVKRVMHPGSVIPARPYLVFQDEDVYGYLFPRIAKFVEEA